MRWLFLFSKPYLLLAAGGLVALMAVTASLGNWQVRRAHEKEVLAQQTERALEGAAVDIGTVILDPLGIDGRKGRVSGRFVPAGTIFLDNRTHKGIAGFHVLTPLQPDVGGPPLLILRGWVARNSQDRLQLPTIETPTGQVSIDGLMTARLPQSLQLATPVAPQASDKIWQFFDLELYASWFGHPVHPYVMRQMSRVDDRLIREWIHPADAVDKHRAYALQWYSMTAGIALFGVISAFRVIRSSSMKSRVKEIV